MHSTAVDLKLFDLMAKNGDDGMSVAQLAGESGADEVLIGTGILANGPSYSTDSLPARMLKHLAATNVVKEISSNQYAATPLCNAFVEPKYRDGITYWSAFCPSSHVDDARPDIIQSRCCWAVLS